MKKLIITSASALAIVMLTPLSHATTHKIFNEAAGIAAKKANSGALAGATTTKMASDYKSAVDTRSFGIGPRSTTNRSISVDITNSPAFRNTRSVRLDDHHIAPVNQRSRTVTTLGDLRAKQASRTPGATLKTPTDTQRPSSNSFASKMQQQNGMANTVTTSNRNFGKLNVSEKQMMADLHKRSEHPRPIYANDQGVLVKPGQQLMPRTVREQKLWNNTSPNKFGSTTQIMPKSRVGDPRYQPINGWQKYSSTKEVVENGQSKQVHGFRNLLLDQNAQKKIKVQTANPKKIK